MDTLLWKWKAVSKFASRLLPISALLAVRRNNSIILRFHPTAFTGPIWTSRRFGPGSRAGRRARKTARGRLRDVTFPCKCQRAFHGKANGPPKGGTAGTHERGWTPARPVGFPPEADLPEVRKPARGLKSFNATTANRKASRGPDHENPVELYSCHIRCIRRLNPGKTYTCAFPLALAGNAPAVFCGHRGWPHAVGR